LFAKLLLIYFLVSGILAAEVAVRVVPPSSAVRGTADGAVVGSGKRFENQRANYYRNRRIGGKFMWLRSERAVMEANSQPACHSSDPGPVTGASHRTGLGTTGRGPVLVVLRNGSVPTRALAFATSLAAGRERELVVLDAVRVARAAPLELPTPRLESHRETTARVVERLDGRRSAPDVTGQVVVGHDVAQLVAEAVEAREAAVVVVDDSWLGVGGRPLARSPLTRLRAAVDCPVAVPGHDLWPTPVSSVLVPVAGGPHSTAAVDLAGDVSLTTGAWVDLLHVVTGADPAARRSAEALLEARAMALAPLDRVDTWVLEAADVATAIVEQSRYYDRTLVGGPRHPRLRRAVFGSTSGAVREGVVTGGVTVWGPGPPDGHGRGA